jgi:hypothetical protein
MDEGGGVDGLRTAGGNFGSKEVRAGSSSRQRIICAGLKATALIMVLPGRGSGRTGGSR